MARANRKTAIAELRQNPADRALVKVHSEAALQLVAQVDAPPTHHAMLGAIRASLDKHRQLRLLRRR